MEVEILCYGRAYYSSRIKAFNKKRAGVARSTTHRHSVARFGQRRYHVPPRPKFPQPASAKYLLTSGSHVTRPSFRIFSTPSVLALASQPSLRRLGRRPQSCVPNAFLIVFSLLEFRCRRPKIWPSPPHFHGSSRSLRARLCGAIHTQHAEYCGLQIIISGLEIADLFRRPGRGIDS